MAENGKTINWEEVKATIARGQQALEDSMKAEPERIQAIYRQRATQLAGRHADLSTANAIQALVFSLGKERYAIELSDLAEVFPLGRYTPVPGARPEILGVINLRGEIRPVIELSRLMGLPESDERPPGYILLLRSGKSQVGLRVDTAEQIRLISSQDIKGRTDREDNVPARYLKGWTTDMLLILRTNAVLSDIFAEEEMER